MNIEVRLPDGSLASFPQGTPQETMQAEIERYLASVEGSPRPAPVSQEPDARPQVDAVGQAQPREYSVRDALGQPQMPMNEMERIHQRELQRRGPPRRNADVQVREKEAPPREKTQRELEAEGARDKFWGGVGYVADRAAGALSAAGTGLYGVAADVAGTGLSIAGATKLGAELERQSDTAYNIASDQLRKGYSSGAGKTQDDYDSEPSDFRRQRAEEKAAAQASEGVPTTEIQPPASSEPAKRQPLRLPRELSVQGAGGTGKGPQFADLSMGDGTSVRVGKVPSKAMKNGVKSGMDFLIERSEAIVLKMLKEGDIHGAREFRDFIRNEQTQKGMKYMNQAVVAANYGDSDAWSSSVARMAKAYEPDGEWSVDRKGTRLIINDNGQAVGAVLALQNKNTGEVFEQEYQGMQNVIAGLSDWGSPTAAYDRQKERVAAAVAQKIKDADSFASAYDEAAKMMFPDGFVDGQTYQPFTQEQMRQADEKIRQYIQASRPDLLPRQPAAPPPGGASGVGAVMGGSNNQAVPTFQ